MWLAGGRVAARQALRLQTTHHCPTHWLLRPRCGHGRGATSVSASHASRRVVAGLDGDTLVLGIETSCDDTATAVVSARGEILGQYTSSQNMLHAPYGGVVPRLAAGAHAACVHDVVDEALRQAGLQSAAQLSAVAVTLGPGLAMCLRVGVSKARGVASQHGLPLVNVHHMEAHALVARLTTGGLTGTLQFPFLTLLVSGGHNMCVLATGVGNYTVLGATLDDALGEAFDKTARLLGLDVGGGGGPALEALAAGGDPKRFPFAAPLRSAGSDHRETCEFSFAGLKTAARITIARELGLPAQSSAGGDAAAVDAAVGVADMSESESMRRAVIRADIAASFQATAVAHVAERTRRALAWAQRLDPRCVQVVVAGGVARNMALRAALQDVCHAGGAELVCPPPQLCTDNGVMVAWAGIERLALGLVDARDVAPCDAAGVPWNDVAVAFVPDIKPRWPLGDRHPDTLGALKNTRSLRKVRLEAPLTGAIAQAKA
jgi:N6-L-threonylcarbamoyladenine synthase